MTRMVAPAPTRGLAPSHSPPDVRYAPGIGLARKLGWFSIGLGLAEALAPRAMAELTGVRRPGLVQLFGIREIATGLGILSSKQPAWWMWGRVAGDALDLGALVIAMVEGDGDDRRGAALAAVAVAGVAALDVMCATQLGAAAALEG